MSDQLDLQQAETLLRAHYARLDPVGLRPDAAARIRRDLERAAGGGRAAAGRLRLEPVRGTPAQTRLTPGWSLAAAAVVAILVLTWIAVGRLSSQPVAGSPSAAVSPGASAVVGGSPSASPGSVAPSGSASVPGAGSPQRAIAFSDRRHGIVVGEYEGRGAIWTTADEGQTWTSQLVSTPPLDSVAVLGTRAWASATCAGEQNCTPAVLTSSDSGATWTAIGSWPIGSLSFVSATHGFGTAVSSDAFVETADGGRTWSAYATPCEAYYVLVGVSFADAQHGWAACDSGGAMGSSNKEVLATDDGGVTWHPRARVRLDETQLLGQIPAAGTFRGIQMLASGTGIAWLSNEGLIRTTDGGITWSRLPLGDAGSNLQWPGAAIAPDGSLYALTVDATSAGGSATFNLGLSDGRDWKPYTEFGALPTPGTTPTPEPTSPPQPAIADSGVAFFDASNGVAIGNGASQAYEWRTADGGKTWTTSALTAASARLMASDGDHVWITTSSCVANPPDPTACASAIERSDDRGATWRTISHQALTSISFGDNTHGFGVGPYVKLEPGNTVGGTGGGIYTTADGGASWKPVPQPLPCGSYSPVSVSFVSAVHGWVGCEGPSGAGQGMKGVMETVDGGSTWTWRSRVDVPGGQASIGSIPSSDYVASISMQADGAGFMTGVRDSTFRTTDGGRTWTTCPPGEFDAFVTSQAAIVRGGPWFVIQSGWIAQGSTVMQVRLMRSDDRGIIWAQVGAVMPNP